MDNFNQQFSSAQESSLNRYKIEKYNEYYSDLYNNIIGEHNNRAFSFDSKYEYNEIVFRRITSFRISSIENVVAIAREQMVRVFSALWTIKKQFCLFVQSNGYELKFYIGTKEENIDILSHIFEGSIPGIEFDAEGKIYTLNSILDSKSRYAGMFAGNPIVRDYKDQIVPYSVLDEIRMGTRGINWSFCVYAIPITEEKTIMDYNKWLDENTRSSEFITVSYNSISGGGISENLSSNKTYSGAQLYNSFSKAYCNILEEALKCGHWKVNAICFTQNETDTLLFGGLLSSQMKVGYENLDRPLPFQFYNLGLIEKNPGFYITGNASFLLSSKELATICGLPTKDTFGMRIVENADFDVSCIQKGDLSLGNIYDGVKLTDVKYNVDINSLNRHGLIIGLTGGGKTNTVKCILKSVYDHKIPFLVIEPAKTEYYELFRVGIDSLEIYSVGATFGNSLKINPFECLEGIPLQTHIDAVFSAFKASFILYTPMPYVLETAIHEIYLDKGWNIETGKNSYGRNDYPTIEDLYYKIAPIVKSMGYDSKMRNDLIGSLTARINTLRIGSKGKTLNVEKSMPISKLLNGQVIIELDNVGDDEVKSFIISIILMQIQEYRKSIIGNHQLDIQHLLLIEEAHRLLKNIPAGSGENADPRGAAVEYFCNMLAELRSKGQGFIIIDQIPSKLAPDIIKNTNLKIIHRTVDSEDRNLVGGAMHMTEHQIGFLSCLEQGVAAVYSEGDNRPKLVKLPYIGDYETQEAKSYDRDEILRLTQHNCKVTPQNFEYINQSCVHRTCEWCSERYHCIPNGNSLLSLLEKDVQISLLNKLFSFSKPGEMSQWVVKDCFSEFPFLNKSYEDYKCCLVTHWIKKYEKQMDYNALSDVYNVVMKYIKRGCDNEQL